MYRFAHMAEKSVISVRPPKDSKLKEALTKLAKQDRRSLNFYVVQVLENHIKKSK